MKKLILTLSLLVFANSAYAAEATTENSGIEAGEVTKIDNPAKAGDVAKANDVVKTDDAVKAINNDAAKNPVNVKKVVKLHKGEEGICNKHDKICLADKARREASQKAAEVKNAEKDKAVAVPNVDGEVKSAADLNAVADPK
jgi:hypothetical protein